MSDSPRRPAALLAFIIPACLLLCSSLNAQGNGPEPLYATVQDTLYLLRVLNGDTIPESLFSASYRYEMAYDSVSHTNYLFTECSRNGTKVNLRHWKYHRMVSAEAAYLTFNSRTVDFPATAGDTIRFYRDLMWYNPLDHRQDTNNYFALDTLDFVVHLVRTSDGAPIAQLDSLGILSCPVVGAPHIYGTRPLMAMVEYVVPAQVTGDSVFVGITVNARGSGNNEFSRYDGVTMGVSRRLKDPFYQEYLSIYGVAYSKRNVEELERIQGSAGARLSVISQPGAPGVVAIRFNGSQRGSTTIAIYDASGRPVFYPYSGRAGESEMMVTHRFESGGVYFVALIHDRGIVKTEKIIITK